MTVPTECPDCKKDLDGGEIPAHLHQYYAPPYRWSHVINVVADDRHQNWLCPSCYYEWE